MRVFQRRRKRGGKRIKAKQYTGEYRPPGKSSPVRVALGVTDKQVAEEKLREIVRRAERRAHGLEPSEQELQRVGRPLSEHLADFVADLRTRGRNAQYICDVKGRVSCLLTECEWMTVRDVNASSFMAWRGKQSKSAKTLNEYLAAMKALLAFMDVRQDNPLANVRPIDARGQQTFRRRALSANECQRLLDAAGDRRPLYLAALLTGLRRGTLYQLRWGHLALDGDKPSMTIPAALMKNRTDHIAPVRSDLAEALRAMRPEGAAQTDRVFAGLLPKWGAEFLRKDLERAGIEPEDAMGGVVDFHALRHTATTLAAETGIHGHVLQAFTTHKTAAQAARYSHVSAEPVRAMIERMPRWEKRTPAERGTESGTGIGTVSAVPNCPDQSSAGTGERNGRSPQSAAKQGANTRKRHVRQRRRQTTPTGFEPVLPG